MTQAPTDRPSFTVNGRTYEPSPVPVVVICVDGSEPSYHEQARAAGRMPWLARTLPVAGSEWRAHCVMPALTNTNNMSIATGAPPSAHGISGNYMFDPVSGEERSVNKRSFLRVPTIFAAANDAGYDVAVVTAKDKLLELLGAGLTGPGPSLTGTSDFVQPRRRGICFSAEKADKATLEDNGIADVLTYVDRALPDVYSADLSEFVLAAGVRLLADRRPDFMYLSLTDYIQHKHAPGTTVANDFYSMLDHYAEQLDELGATVIITADHGMSAKTDALGRPQVIYVGAETDRLLAGGESRVVLPITDPYPVHHGALGSFASVYLPAGTDHADVASRLAQITGVQAVHTREDAADRYALPADRIGDLVVLAEKDYALGGQPEWHDVDSLDAPLRSHGALGEINIPFLINRKLPTPADLDQNHAESACIHNYDAFWVATTALAASRQD